MVLEHQGSPLVLKEVPRPIPGEGELLIKVSACAICRTDLHILDGELTPPKLPLIMGHQVVGEVVESGKHFKQNQRVGLPWLGKTCGTCPYCLDHKENLCDSPTFTGYNHPGGFAEYVAADESFIFPLSEEHSAIELAPLLCAGMIGYRSLKMIAGAKTIGFYGFGASAHLLIQVARYQQQEVYAFTRKGDIKTQKEALQLGAVWAGDTEGSAPILLDAIIIFAPVGALVPKALQAVKKAGSVICAGIHMSDIPSFPYNILWGERIIRSVANLTRADGEEFLALAAKVPVKTDVARYPLEKANEALQDLREGNISGSAVLIP